MDVWIYVLIGVLSAIAGSIVFAVFVDRVAAWEWPYRASMQRTEHVSLARHVHLTSLTSRVWATRDACISHLHAFHSACALSAERLAVPEPSNSESSDVKLNIVPPAAPPDRRPKISPSGRISSDLLVVSSVSPEAPLCEPIPSCSMSHAASRAPAGAAAGSPATSPPPSPAASQARGCSPALPRACVACGANPAALGCRGSPTRAQDPVSVHYV